MIANNETVIPIVTPVCWLLSPESSINKTKVNINLQCIGSYLSGELINDE